MRRVAARPLPRRGHGGDDKDRLAGIGSVHRDGSSRGSVQRCNEVIEQGVAGRPPSHAAHGADVLDTRERHEAAPPIPREVRSPHRRPTPFA